MNKAAEIAFNHFVKAQRADYPEWMRAYARHERWNMPDLGTVEAQLDLFRTLSWVFEAVTIAAETAAGQTISVLKREGEDLTDIPNHDFEVLLDNPNELDASDEFLIATYAFRKLAGNAYWWTNRTSESQPPAELWIVPPNQIQPIPDERLFLKGYVYDPGDGQKLFLEPWEIVHFKTFNPLNRYVGMSFVESIAIAAIGDMAAAKWNTELFGANNARLPGILAFADFIGDDAWDQIKADMVSSSEKRNIMRLRGVGPGGVQWMQSAVSQKEMEFLAGRQFTKEEIWGNFPGLSSMMDPNATEANSKAGKQTFLESCIFPMTNSIGKKVTKALMPAYGDSLVCQVEDPRQVDKVLELQEQEAFSRTHTINEVRKQYYGDDELEDDRGLLLPAQVGAAAIPMYVARGEEPPEMPPQFGQQTPPEEEGEEQPDDNAEEMPEEAQAEDVKAELGRWQRKALSALKRGKGAAVEFESDIIPLSLAGAIDGALEACKAESDIKRVFRDVWMGYP